MNRMLRRILALIVCIAALLGTACPAFAAEDPVEPSAETGCAGGNLPGDMDGNGLLEATDARALLRMAVGLERPAAGTLPYGDLDADGLLGAADARLALRMAVGLEPLQDRHAYEITDETAPACTEAGALTYQCVFCKKTGALALPATGHAFGGPVTVPPTCTEAGSQTQTCETCGYPSVSVLPATGHAFGEPVTMPPTCTEAGSQTQTCETCGYRSVSALPATGHAFGEPVTVAPTCTETGTQTEICAVCGEKRETALAALGHNWVAATPKKAKHCARCGEIAAGWTQIGGSWYYFLASGAPAKGKQTIGGKFYRFNANGVSETGRTPATPKVAVLGDSLVEALSLSLRSTVKDFDFYGKVSLHVTNMATAKRKSGRTVLDEVVGRNYDKIIIIIGINDLGYGDSAWGEQYRKVIRGVKSRAPGAEVLAHSILPVNNARARANGYSCTMAQVNRKNAVIKRIAAQEKIRYLNANTALTDSSGQLPYNAAGDGIHIGRAYSRRWYDWVRTVL